MTLNSCVCIYIYIYIYICMGIIFSQIMLLLVDDEAEFPC